MNTNAFIQFEEFTENPWPIMILTILVLVGIWLLVRQGILWYYKIDKILEALHEINHTLQGRESSQSDYKSGSAIKLSRFEDDITQMTWKCPKCEHQNNNNTYQCLGCGYKLL